MQKADIFVAQMMLDFVGHRTGEISRVDYRPQKPAYRRDSANETHFERSSPESCGISSAWLTHLFRRLAAEPESGLHRIMVLRGNRVIGETSFAPFPRDEWHVSHSLAKSVTAMAIGLLIGEGRLSLDDRLVDIFRDRSILAMMMLRDTLTIRHLLQMSSGVKFNEAGAISGNNWKKDYMEAGCSFEPGTAFEYNSMNSYMLSAVVTKLTGETMMEYLRPRLWEPLGIDRVFWEMSPESITKGGWGLFIRTEDMAKLGRLYLQGGKWEDRQILPPDFVRESTKVQIHTGMERCELYGFHLWINDDRGVYAYSFNGMLGQNVFCYPDLDMVICTSAGNGEIFQQGKMSGIIREEMKTLQAVELPLPENTPALNELKMLCRRLSGRTPAFSGISSGGWQNTAAKLTVGSRGTIRSSKTRHRTRLAGNASAWIRQKEHLRRELLKRLNGAVYDLDNRSVGVFPLLMQVVHNNFTDGISSIGFRRKRDGTFLINLYEGNAIYVITCGFYGSVATGQIDMHGEIYDIAVRSDFTTDENDRPVLKNEIFYVEEAATRILNIYLEPSDLMSPDAPEKIEVRLDETPGSAMIVPSLKMITTEKAGNGLDGFFLKQFSDIGGMNAVNMLAYATIRPTVFGSLRKEVSS
ncbi:MAG: beta-lactamase family protein [Lachnospiraceae bacterium]|nr:beta-lactamase family protein [Lachnospiraceae bacterium]